MLHWLTGTAAEAWRAVDLGCYFSVNTEMLANEKRAMITKALPLDRILTETDGPFTQIDARPAAPSDVWVAMQGLARLHGTPPADIEAMITRNLKSGAHICPAQSLPPGGKRLGVFVLTCSRVLAPGLHSADAAEALKQMKNFPDGH